MSQENTSAGNISRCGILPVNRDGFESGDYENFALVYIGDSEDWIHPKAEITKDQPIIGKYSLRWNADDVEQRWMFVSNAFYLRRPYKVSVKVRIDDVEGDCEVALLGAIESYHGQEKTNRAIVDALRLSGSDVYLDINANAVDWSNGADARSSGVIKTDTVYVLSMIYSEDGGVSAEVVGDDSQQVIAQFSSKSSTENNGVGLFVHLGPAKSGHVTYDDFRVDSAPYQVKAGKLTRSPQFVILPRRPDAIQDQGEWVGGASAMHDEGVYKLWYRIRRADVRGVGYGYATSKDGLQWRKCEDNPIMSFDKEKYSSCEKISVLKVDGQYKAWYTVNVPREWHVIYTTSDDGINWTDYGEVLKDGMYKDPDVIYVDGTYYMYVIHPTGRELSVLTSEDGIKWTFESTIPAPGHTHPAAYYVEDTGKFWLYEDIPEIRAASSDDGIHFDEFQTVLAIPPVGLDDNRLESDGVNYPTFFRDGLGHLKTDKDILMVYQARHSYLNNRPSWKFAQDGKLVLAGRFTGLHVNVPVEIYPDGSTTFSTFPIHCQRIWCLDVLTDAALRITVNSWTPDAQEVGSWTTESDNAHVKYSVCNLVPGTEYKLLVDGQGKSSETADAEGVAEYEVEIAGKRLFRLVTNR